MTLNYYKKAYESGVEFGLNKAIEAEMILNRDSVKVRAITTAARQWQVATTMTSTSTSTIRMTQKLTKLSYLPFLIDSLFVGLLIRWSFACLLPSLI